MFTSVTDSNPDIPFTLKKMCLIYGEVHWPLKTERGRYGGELNHWTSPCLNLYLSEVEMGKVWSLIRKLHAGFTYCFYFCSIIEHWWIVIKQLNFGSLVPLSLLRISWYFIIILLLSFYHSFFITASSLKAAPTLTRTKLMAGLGQLERTNLAIVVGKKVLSRTVPRGLFAFFCLLHHLSYTMEDFVWRKMSFCILHNGGMKKNIKCIWIY